MARAGEVAEAAEPSGGAGEVGDASAACSSSSPGASQQPRPGLPEGMQKDILKPGFGFTKPEQGEEVRMTLKVLEADGSTVGSWDELEYTIGSGSLGPELSSWVDGALLSMKREEEASCRIPDGLTLQLCLHDIQAVKDVSPAQDQSLVKKVLRSGDGDPPNDGSSVQVRILALSDDAVALPGFEAVTLSFALGEGEVCDLVERAVLRMKRGERALITCTRPQLFHEERCGVPVGKLPASGKVTVALELLGFERARDPWTMSETERVDFALSRKEVGSRLFARGRTELALERYRAILELLRFVDNFRDDQQQRARDLKKVCHLNVAACHLRLRDYHAAIAACEEVLQVDTRNVKALFRRAQAHLELSNLQGSVRDLRQILEVDSQQAEARALLKRVFAMQREADQAARSVFARMCGGASPGPQVTSDGAATGAASE